MRPRQFTGDDLVAFAQAFDLPVTYFFLPPSPRASWSKVGPGISADGLNRTMAIMIDLIPNRRSRRWVRSHGLNASRLVIKGSVPIAA